MAQAYYNENDKYAARWLRNLIAAGHIARGDVDERDIRDVQPAELRGYAQCHFFAGIGGWSYALRLAGWPDERPVWTGSCPCQPFSAAGKRQGTDDARHLWPAWFDLVRECRPVALFGEQVANGGGMAWLDDVLADLEGIEYAVGAVDLPACGVGAPHIRNRLWFVADAELSERRTSIEQRTNDQHEIQARQQDTSGPGECRATGELADPNGRNASAEGLQRSGEHGQQPQDGGASGVMADAEPQHNRGGCSGTRRRIESSNGGEVGELADIETIGLGQGRANPSGSDEGIKPQGPRVGSADDGGTLMGYADSMQSEQLTGKRPRPEETQSRWACSESTGPGASIGFWTGADWLPCIDGKARPVEPGTQQMVDGISRAVGRLRSDKKLKEEITNAATSSGIEAEIVRAMRQGHAAQTIWQTAGRCLGFPAALLLLAYLCEQSGELGQFFNGQTACGSQAGNAELREMRTDWQAACSSSGWELPEQCILELADFVPKMSQAHSYLGQFTGMPLSHGIPNRVGRLRAYGNAIVPQVAAEVIGAYMMRAPAAA